MISLLHPSRGRPQKAWNTAQNWVNNAGCDVEHLISLDEDDPTLPEYLFRFKNVCVSDNKSVVQATNVGAKHVTGDIIIYLSDDFLCFPNWAEAIIKEFDTDKPMLLKVDDCLQRFDVPVLTIPIMNRALLNLLGYFFHPDFKSMFVDEQLYWKCRKLGVIKLAPHLKFEHAHVSAGKAPDDETYRRSARNWDQGKAMFAKHKSAGFP